MRGRTSSRHGCSTRIFSGGVAALLARLVFRLRGPRHRLALVWGVHRTEVPTAKVGVLLKSLARLCALASNRMPDSVICCANAAFRTHADYGYERSKMRVIHNGFDVHTFVPDATARAALLGSLGLPSQATLIGIVGRANPAKDYDNFLRAAALLRPRVADCHFVMVGRDVDANNEQLGRTIDERRCPRGDALELSVLAGLRSQMLASWPDFSCL
jgi:glycosyltransferase involved in cell wall biosynthesis